MHFDDDNDDHISRSQKKRDSTAAQKLGTALSSLPKGDLEALGLPGPLFEAILDWKKFPGHEAKRRQMQFIGRVMRDMDIAALEGALNAHLAPGRAETEALHGIETLRDTLTAASGDDLERELSALAARYPDAPVARLRHLASTAAHERAGKKPPKAYRELFRLLRAITEKE